MGGRSGKDRVGDRGAPLLLTELTVKRVQSVLNTQLFAVSLLLEDQRDGMGSVGGEIKMGDPCAPMADSCQCMAKTHYNIVK